MEVVLIIPARGGSKRIPHKNLLPINNLPLLLYSINHALNSKLVNRVIVSTDDPKIKQFSLDHGANVVLRPKELSDDKATSESALIHVLDYLLAKENYSPDLVVFLQCTSPIRKSDDIDNAIKLFIDKNADSLFSACINDKFIWALEKDGPKPLNYDYNHRKREQDMPPQYRENGSIYVFKPSLLRKSNNRLGGKMVIYPMNYWSSFQIDSPEDVALIDWILKSGYDKRD